MRRAPLLLAAFLTLAALPAHAWETYENPAYGYSISLPGSPFAVEEEPDGRGVTLIDLAGRGQIDVYGARNSEGLSPREFEAALGSADRIRDITYARRGQSWFVISGHYVREGDAGDDLIFYAKFMFSPDRTRLSAFEASYPVADKARWDPIIEQMEDTLRAPLPAADQPM
jgi:hypothetical protein